MSDVLKQAREALLEARSGLRAFAGEACAHTTDRIDAALAALDAADLRDDALRDLSYIHGARAAMGCAEDTQKLGEFRATLDRQSSEALRALKAARAALDAAGQAPAPVVPEGWKLVPDWLLAMDVDHSPALEAKCIEISAELCGGARPDAVQVLEMGAALIKAALSDLSAPSVEATASCHDCRRPYGTWPDMLVSNDVWESITPADDPKGGLLCPTCIAARVSVAGLDHVPAAFVSAPLVSGVVVSKPGEPIEVVPAPSVEGETLELGTYLNEQGERRRVTWLPEGADDPVGYFTDHDRWARHTTIQEFKTWLGAGRLVSRRRPPSADTEGPAHG